ncbi:hypothetical protein BJY54_005595 [Streptomyces nodosus]|nr:hypothetical protein [Streptomyces nodosus]
MTEARPGAAAASLWERDAELAVVTEAVDALRHDGAPTGSGNLLVFGGEAGIGKTALLAETRRIAERRGCTVWSARGGETVTSVPFHVVRQLLKPGLLGLEPEEARGYLGDAYEIAGPALGVHRTRCGAGRPTGCVRRSGRGRLPARQTGVAAGPDRRRRALGGPGDPALAGIVL